ncbi:CHASE2 domain-containing protein [Burkholderia ubonensis]|uniref:CHASE2 domain-containing protein n=1 Tax=Burkholderia ubonensis TaxID=101571 RepID=UPI0009B3005E|nr:CHASE2 domain-containing protein [Burkholderia ubonensis]
MCNFAPAELELDQEKSLPLCSSQSSIFKPVGLMCPEAAEFGDAMTIGAIRKAMGKTPLRALGWTVVIAFAIWLLQNVLEKTELGKRIELGTFAFLQSVVPDFDPKDRLPVVVVDISGIPGGANVRDITPRDKLRPLIDAIAKAHPAAIAVDIDFSPDEHWWRDPHDPEFFDFCMDLRAKPTEVPVFLGAFLARDDGQDAWLGSSLFADMAVDVQVGLESSADVTSRAYTHFLSLDHPNDRPLKTMSYALAEAYIGEKYEHRTWPMAPRLLWLLPIESLVKPLSTKDPAIFGESDGYLINYSKISQIKHETLLTITNESAIEFTKYFEHKMVILGRTEAADRFSPPGGPPEAGVYAHAVAAYTFAIAPIFELKLPTRISLDLIFTSPLFALILFPARPRENCEPLLAQRLADERENRWAWLSALCVVILGFLLMRTMQIMWLDFILVAAAQIVHPSVKRWIDTRLELRARASTRPNSQGGAKGDSKAAIAETSERKAD